MPEMNDALWEEFGHLDISVRAVNVLIRAQIITLRQLRGMSETDLRAIKGVGDRTIEELYAAGLIQPYGAH